MLQSDVPWGAACAGVHPERPGLRARADERFLELLARTAVLTPPRLAVRDAGPDALEVTYDSPRRLCAFLEGLVLGTAAHYGEEVELEQTTCMHRGDPACGYRIRFPTL